MGISGCLSIIRWANLWRYFGGKPLMAVREAVAPAAIVVVSRPGLFARHLSAARYLLSPPSAGDSAHKQHFQGSDLGVAAAKCQAMKPLYRGKLSDIAIHLKYFGVARASHRLGGVATSGVSVSVSRLFSAVTAISAAAMAA